MIAKKLDSSLMDIQNLCTFDVTKFGLGIALADGTMNVVLPMGLTIPGIKR